MPVHYQTIGIPGGPERNSRYAGQMFHNDMSIVPIRAGVLGNQYLDHITAIMKQAKAAFLASQ